MYELSGVTRRVSSTVASAGAGNTDLPVRPAAGCVWEVLMLYAYQDDGAVAQSWHWTDPDVSAGQLYGITGASGSYWHFVEGDDTASIPSKIRGPVVVTYDRYPTFRFVASAGAKNATYVALVREWRGVPVEV